MQKILDQKLSALANDTTDIHISLCVMLTNAYFLSTRLPEAPLIKSPEPEHGPILISCYPFICMLLYSIRGFA